MDATQRLTPACRVSLDGVRLAADVDASMAKVDVDLDVDLFGQCVLTFNDPKLDLTNGEKFQPGAAVKVEVGYASQLQTLFEGEVVALEPQFRRDLPLALRVVCHEALHRLALSRMTRSFLNADQGEVIRQIARENGLSGEAPSGTKEHILQGDLSDATLLRRLAQRQGNHLSIDGKKLVIAPPPTGGRVSITPESALRSIRVKIKAGQQVSEVHVHGFDPQAKQEFVGKAKGEGEVGDGTREYGNSATLAVAGLGEQPRDLATAEAMAKGRMRKLAEGHVVARVKIVGDPELVPGASVSLERIGGLVDGTYRVERAHHELTRHGYWVRFDAVRTSKTSRGAAAEQQAAKIAQAARQRQLEEARRDLDSPAAQMARAEQRRKQGAPVSFLDLTVVDELGQLAAGRPVKVELPDGTTFEGKLDEAGRLFRENLPSGIGRLYLMNDGVAPGLEARRGAPEPERSSFLDVVLLDEAGRPLAELEVDLELPDGTREKVRTDAAGRLRRDGLAAGLARIHLPDEEGGAAAQRLARPPPEEPKESYLEVVLLDDAGEPLADREVEVELPDGVRERLRTDGAGRLRKERVARGAARIRLPDEEGAESARRRAQPAVTGAPASFLDVELLGEGGAPLAAREVELELPGGAREKVRTDGEGRLYREAIPSGQARIYLPDEARAEELARQLQQRPAEPRESFFEVELLDDQGRPRAGLPVQLELADGRLLDAKTDPLGRLRRDDVPPGAVRLSIPVPE